MFQLPYQTTPCTGHILTGLETALQHAAIDGILLEVKTPKGAAVEGLYEVPPYFKAVMPFTHPLVISTSDGEKMVMDSRAFTSADRINGTLRITNASDYEFLRLRSRLSLLWNQGHGRDLIAIGDIVPRTFTRHVSEAIVRRLALTQADQMLVAVMTAYFYFCQFETQDMFSEEDMLKQATRIARVTSVGADHVLRILDSIKDAATQDYPLIKDAGDFLETLKTISPNPRMATLNLGLFYSTVTGVWYGANAREVVGVAMEYPPYFIALVYCALTDRSYHSTPLNKLVMQLDRRDAGRDFVRNLSNYLEMNAHA